MSMCHSCGTDSPADARFCAVCGAPLEAADAREVRKMVTIVFSDLVGSTEMGEGLDPESLRAVMSTYFDQMREIIERHGGTVEKFIGDAIMAVFGVPTMREDDALRAVRAAHEMRIAVGTLNADLERRWKVRLQTRTGINTGTVVAGDSSTRQPMVTGDTVNLAARLEQHAPGGEILIGDITRRLTRDLIETQTVEPLTMKGKAEPMPAFLVLAVNESRARSRTTMASPLVGRDEELGRLQRILAEAKSTSTGRLCTILGAPGLGKTRLAAELISTCGDWRVLQGRCPPAGEGRTMAPLTEILRAAAGTSEGEQVEHALGALAVETGDAALADGLSQLLDLQATAVPAHELFGTVRRLFSHLAQERPLLLCFDDIQWAESLLLDLLENVVTWTRDAPIVVICMARPELAEVRPLWLEPSERSDLITLESLKVDASAELLSSLLDGGTVAEDVRRRISDAAQGNPFVLEELIAMLVDDGQLQRIGDAWVAARDIELLAMPPSVSALIGTRLERLPGDRRVLLERGSIIGQSFYGDAVTDISPQRERPTIPAKLAGLTSTEMIRADVTDFPGHDAFRFRHMLIRDAAYNATLKESRAELHGLFADWLGSATGAHAREYDEVIGFHLERAFHLREELGAVDEETQRVAGRASIHLGAAGLRALERADLPAARGLLERAVALGDPASLDVARLLPGLAETLIDAGDFDASTALLERAATAAAALGDEGLAAFTRLTRLDLDLLVAPVGRAESGDQEIADAIGVFERTGDERGLARAYTEAAYLAMYRCMAGRAADAALAAYEHAQAAGMYGGRHLSEYALALLYGPVHADEALARIEWILGQHDAGEVARSSARQAEGVLRAMRGEFDQARALVAEGALIDQQLGRHVAGTMAAAEMLGEIEFLAGDLSAAERALRSGYEALVGWGERGYATTLAAMLTRVLAHLDRLPEAEELVATARGWADDDDILAQVLWHGAAARIQAATHRNDPGPAIAMGEHAVQLASETDHTNLLADALADLANVLTTLDDPRATATALLAAASYADKGNIMAKARIEERFSL